VEIQEEERWKVTFKGLRRVKLGGVRKSGGESRDSNQRGRGKSGCAAVGPIANASLLIGVDGGPELFNLLVVLFRDWCNYYYACYDSTRGVSYIADGSIALYFHRSFRIKW
jgi:hypothetical protein